MESSSIRRKVGGNWPGGTFSGRRGPIAIAAAAAVIAGILLFVFVQQYKKSVNGTVSTTAVFVATHFIQKGTATNSLATDNAFQRTLVKTNQVRLGAITDSAAIAGDAAAVNIYPGQQLTTADFTASDVTIASQLSRTQRAIAVPVDAIHGLVPYVTSGDYVDVLEGGGQASGGVTTLAQNVLVLAVGGAGGGGGGVGGGGAGGEIVLRVTDKTATAFANAGQIWLTLRPPFGAVNSVHPIVKIGQ
jgi:Flp pilus assembly protein CpaB